MNNVFSLVLLQILYDLNNLFSNNLHIYTPFELYMLTVKQFELLF